jgi:hypothetical protein
MKLSFQKPGAMGDVSPRERAAVFRTMRGIGNTNDQMLAMRVILQKICQVDAIPDPDLSAEKQAYAAGSRACGIILMQLGEIEINATRSSSSADPSDARDTSGGDA